MIPDFLIIGGQRCGTTWLASVLEQHPAIGMSVPKELHYFNRFVLTRDRAWYESHFPERSDDRGLLGDATPAYGALGPEPVAAIKQVRPEVRAIMVIRHPIDRSWSHICRGYGPGPNRPEEFLRLPRALVDLHRAEQRARNDFVTTARTWQDALGRDRLHVVVFDDLVGEPQQALDEITAYLGLAHHDFDLSRGERFGAHLIDMPPEALWHLHHTLDPLIEEQVAYFGPRIKPWLDRHPFTGSVDPAWVRRHRSIVAATTAEKVLTSMRSRRRQHALADAITSRLG